MHRCVHGHFFPMPFISPDIHRHVQLFINMYIQNVGHMRLKIKTYKLIVDNISNHNTIDINNSFVKPWYSKHIIDRINGYVYGV